MLALMLLLFLCVSGGRVEKKEEGGTIGNDQKQRSTEVCDEEKGKRPGIYPINAITPSHDFKSLCVPLQSSEDDEAFKLLQLSKEEQPETRGDQEDEELIVAEYESDDESKTRSR